MQCECNAFANLYLVTFCDSILMISSILYRYCAAPNNNQDGVVNPGEGDNGQFSSAVHCKDGRYIMGHRIGIQDYQVSKQKIPLCGVSSRFCSSFRVFLETIEVRRPSNSSAPMGNF